jgi:hypothetical protein
LVQGHWLVCRASLDGEENYQRQKPRDVKPEARPCAGRTRAYTGGYQPKKYKRHSLIILFNSYNASPQLSLACLASNSPRYSDVLHEFMLHERQSNVAALPEAFLRVTFLKGWQRKFD